jgi:hypothetical protein
MICKYLWRVNAVVAPPAKMGIFLSVGTQDGSVVILFILRQSIRIAEKKSRYW